MTNRRQRVAPARGLIRRIEQLEGNRVKGEQLTSDGPQNSVAGAIGGNGRGVTARIDRARFPRRAEQSPGQRKSHERRGIGGEVYGVVPVVWRREDDVVVAAAS